ncbi:MAG: hypothetical protein RL625_138 [Gemmatimonadota bacterium]
MTEPRNPEATRASRVYRPAPSPAASPRRAEEGLISRILAVSSEFDERGLLDELEPGDRNLVERRLREELVAGIVTLRWVAFPIFVALLLLDWLRWKGGLFSGSGIEARLYTWLVVSHLLIGVGALLSFWVAANRRQDPSAQVRNAVSIHMVFIALGLLLMAPLALTVHRSTFGFAVAVIVGNLIYHLPRPTRVVFNLIAAMIAVYAVRVGYTGEATATMLRFTEVSVVLVLTVLAGSLVRRQRIRSIIVEQRLSSLALVDGLTGVASRRRVEEVAEGEIAMSASDRPLSIILLDLDNFKNVNDSHGHNAGDEVLRGVARLLQQRSRLNDTVGRWGGEEFLMVLPDTPATGALELAEALRGRIARQLFEGIGSCTASFGVAESRAGDLLIDLIARADTALYDAKRAGRNRVREAVPPELTGTHAAASATA